MSTNHTHAVDHDDGQVHAHISSTPFYLGIFGCLIFLTLLTVKVSYYDFGSANIVIALLIATMKGGLVAAFFMHLRYDKLFNTLTFLAAFLFLAIFILLTYDDLGVRAQQQGQSYVTYKDGRSGELAPGGEPATSATSVSEEGTPPAGSAAPRTGSAAPEKK
ncbi:MAG TPA: cytochrome C oxidase subunit IV family protein [Polyangiaceae bacterium]|jgi:cytochrome c oxidase subunit 4